MMMDDFIEKEYLQQDVEAAAYSFIEAGFVTKLELAEMILVNVLDGAVTDIRHDMKAAKAPFVEESVIAKRAEELIRLFSDELYDKTVIKQESWGGTTHQKLAVAFKELETQGIRAEMNFECCNSCGGYAMKNDGKSEGYKGYVFFHEQDMESLLFERVMYLSYSMFNQKYDNEEEVALAKQIIKVLKKHSFEIEWDGTADHRIRIINLGWTKRLID
jgi:hypothetical protein